MNGADLFVRELADRGTQFVTTLSGNGTEPFYAACARAGMPLVDFRNEQAASFAADAAARLSGRVGVCAVSAAVGHANAMIGLVNAWFDGAPVLLFSGSSEHGHTDQGKFQDFNQVAMAAAFCKYAKLVDRPERIPFSVAAAYAAATAGRPGPVHLTIPADVLAAEVAPPAQRPSPESGRVLPRGAPDPALVAELAALLVQAERPLLVAGSGAFYAGAGPVLEAFARATDIPVIVPIWDRGVVDRPIPQFLGVVGAASGGPTLLPDADLILLVGARLDYRVGYGEPPALAPDAALVRIDADPAELRQGRDPDLALQADPASALAALTASVTGRADFAPKRAWLAEARRRRDEFRRPWAGPLPADGPITGRHIVEAVRACLDDETILLVDGGNIGQWAHALADRYPSHWLTCGASGVVGWGVAGAIAARLLNPERPILLLSGDGALGFGLPEFETAVRHGAPFVCVLADDRAWGSVASGQLKRGRGDDLIACRLGPVRYDLVAEGLGALGIRVDAPEALAPAIRRGLESGRPTLIDVAAALGGPGEV